MLSRIPEFKINCPAAEADQALKQAVGALEKAEHAVVLCSACHRLWHQHGGVPQVATRIPSVRRR